MRSQANDPGVMIDIYNTNLNQKAYTVPGRYLFYMKQLKNHFVNHITGPEAFTC